MIISAESTVFEFFFANSQKLILFCTFYPSHASFCVLLTPISSCISCRKPHKLSIFLEYHEQFGVFGAIRRYEIAFGTWNIRVFVQPRHESSRAFLNSHPTSKFVHKFRIERRLYSYLEHRSFYPKKKLLRGQFCLVVSSTFSVRTIFSATEK